MAANDALTDRDQDQAATILQRSSAATLPGTSAPVEPQRPIHQTPPPTPPPHRSTPTPTPPPAGIPTPPPYPAARPVAFHTPYPPTGGPPVSGPTWTTPPPPPPRSGPQPKRAGKGVPWVPIVAAGALFVLVLGALGIWWLVKPDDSSGMATTTTTETEPTETTETTRRTPRTTTPTQNPESFDAKLLAMLPRGYDDDACRAVNPPATGALATVDCGAASPIGGPGSARYSLFADQQTLDTHFDESIAQNSDLLPCPGSGADSPTTWHYTATPDKVEGRIACGTYNNNADVVWTKNADLLLADAQGTNLEDLHNWWLKFG